jgi:hypothetical protein
MRGWENQPRERRAKPNAARVTMTTIHSDILTNLFDDTLVKALDTIN